jgi:iron complex outermembrane receptor protein
MRKASGIATAIVVLASTSAHGQQTGGLADLSIQDLMNIEVTSVSRKTQEVVRTAAAVYVITRDDIRRSGATNLPDVLRMAPGFSVAELSANTWSATTRGFGGVHANKLLVLIDGRSIYSVLNGGVNWEMQLLPLDSIEQIELIRGPGGSIWGSNAINGVVNIITKSADHAQGGRLETHASRYEPGTLELGYGGKVGSTGHYIARARYFQRQTPGLTSGFSGADDVEAFYGRTRLDWTVGTDDFSVRADVASGEGSQVQPTVVLVPPFRIATKSQRTFSATSTQFSWKRTHSSRADTALQAYYSGNTRSDIDERDHVVDVDAKHHRALGDRHDIVMGGEYRYIDSAVGHSRTIAITPLDADVNLITGFLQDEIAVVNRLRVTVGAKVEDSAATAVEVQPSVRALWMVSSRQSVWGAVSRAVRTPNRFERGMHIVASAAPGPNGLPLVVTLQGSTDTVSEVLTEYEAGYRVQHSIYSVDLAGFVGSYAHLASFEPGTPGVAEELGARVFRIPLTAGSVGQAKTRGIEVATTVRPAGWWQVSTNYSFSDVDFEGSSQGVPVNGPTPKHQFHVRTYLDLPRHIDASALFYSAANVPDISVAAYTRLDLQMAWSPSESVRFGGGVRSLLHDPTSEYADNTSRAVTTPVRPSPYAEIRWWF